MFDIFIYITLDNAKIFKIKNVLLFSFHRFNSDVNSLTKIFFINAPQKSRIHVFPL